MADKRYLFVYGTLLDPEIREIVIGDHSVGTEAQLFGYQTRALKGRLFPFVRDTLSEQAQGLVLDNLSAAQMAAIDFYLDQTLFERGTSLAKMGEQVFTVQVHLPREDDLADGGAWDFAQWQKTSQPAALRAAVQIMRSFAVAGVHNTPIHHHGVDMRAYSNLRASRSSAPVHIRRGFGSQDVETLSRRQPYANYFAVEDMQVRHKQFQGGKSEVLDRAVYLSADAVTVLPYDPVTDRVLLIEQFRPAAFARDDAHPWVLEPVAGRCDADEPVETVAEREMMEEAGLSLRGLEKIGNYYSSPGCVTEYLYSFVGIVDLSGASGETHGLETEGEDILTHILPYAAAIETLTTGEADIGPLFISLLWLQLHRARLRKEWGGA